MLLVGEPTSALDLGRQQEVLDLIDALRRERDLTVVAAMHTVTEMRNRRHAFDRGVRAIRGIDF